MKYIYLLVSLFVASSAFGDFDHTAFGESFMIGKTVYHDVKILSINAGVLTIDTKEGQINVSWLSLPSEFQKKHINDVILTPEGLNDKRNVESDKQNKIEAIREQIKAKRQAITDRQNRDTYHGYHGRYSRSSDMKYVIEKEQEIEQLKKQLKNLGVSTAALE